jgi:2-polyprenyl-6-methoxyphenol hydroxylase-like FAD-dependent oxidoreductase
VFKKHSTDALVVGAGPVGLFAALALAKNGLSVQIVDEESRTAAHSLALAVHPATLSLLHEYGLDQALQERGLIVDTVAFYDHERRRAEVRLSELSGDFPFLLVLRQSDLEGVLERALRHVKVKVGWNRRAAGFREEGGRIIADVEVLDRVTTGYPVATAETQVIKKTEIEAGFVVGADGYRSTVRQYLRIPFERTGDSELFGVFEFDSDADLRNEVRIALTEGTTNVVWPLPGGQYRWSFQLADDSEKLSNPRYKSRLAVQIGLDSFPYLSGEFLEELIKERAPWFDGSPGQIHWSVLVRFDRLLAARFGQGRFRLAGDAVHLTGPVAARSMNSGLREVHNVAALAGRFLRDEVPIESFDAWEEHHRTDWKHLLGLEGWVHVTDHASDWVRRHATALFDGIPASGDELETLAGQVGLEVVGDTHGEPVA